MKFLVLTFIALLTSSLAQPVPAGGNPRQAQSALKKADAAHPAKFRIFSKREDTQPAPAFGLTFGKRQDAADAPPAEAPQAFGLTSGKRDRS